MCCSYYAGYPKEFNWIIEEVAINFDSQGKCDLRFFGTGQTFWGPRAQGKQVECENMKFTRKFFFELKNSLPNNVKDIIVFYNKLLSV